MVSAWLMVEPELALAPLIPPVIVPIVQVKVLAKVAVKPIFVVVPLQMVAVFTVVTAGAGLTVTVIVKGVPAQDPAIAVGVTKYVTVPDAISLGFTSISLIVPPEVAVAPVMPPDVEPIVQEKLLGVLDVNKIFALVPLQTLVVGELVTIGVGLTVTIIVNGAPEQEPAMEVGVTIYCTVPAVALPGLVST